jgi:hypothetical protein
MSRGAAIEFVGLVVTQLATTCEAMVRGVVAVSAAVPLALHACACATLTFDCARDDRHVLLLSLSRAQHLHVSVAW